MPVIGLGKIPFDVGVQGCLFVRILLRLFEDVTGADLAQEIPDQHPARAVDETVDGHGVLPLELDLINWARQAARAQVAVVQPERFHCIAELRFSLRVHQFEDLLSLGF